LGSSTSHLSPSPGRAAASRRTAPRHLTASRSGAGHTPSPRYIGLGSRASRVPPLPCRAAASRRTAPRHLPASHGGVGNAPSSRYIGLGSSTSHLAPSPGQAAARCRIALRHPPASQAGAGDAPFSRYIGLGSRASHLAPSLRRSTARRRIAPRHPPTGCGCAGHAPSSPSGQTRRPPWRAIHGTARQPGACKIGELHRRIRTPVLTTGTSARWRAMHDIGARFIEMPPSERPPPGPLPVTSAHGSHRSRPSAVSARPRVRPARKGAACPGRRPMRRNRKNGVSTATPQQPRGRPGTGVTAGG
jgi:hypothetical protein